MHDAQRFESLTAPPPTENAGGQWQPWFHRNAQLTQVDAQLSANPALHKDAQVSLRYQRAMLLTQLGRTAEARSEHLRVVQLDPSYVRNLNAFGLLLATTGNRKASLIVLSEAVRLHPASLVSRVNYGGVLLEEGDAFTARQQFEAALAVDPQFANAHAGLYYAMAKLGDSESAEFHRRLGFSQKNIFTNLYRGNGQPVPVLLLVSSTGGNAPIEKVLDDTVFQSYVVVADFYDPAHPLPAHQLVINGIGDVEVSQAALLAAESLLAHSTAPVINPPRAILATGRCENAARLRAIPGIVTPATQLFPYSVLAAPEGADALQHHGFAFPLLLRAPGFHMGQHFVMVESPTDLADAVAQLPGAGRPGAQILAIEYLDARGSDSFSRKYRVMMIGGRLYPLHLAISPNWKIHYFSADMADQPDHRDEEARFLADMPAVLGSRAMAGLKRLQSELGLDYAGIDFGLNRDGEILLFEANATMVVQPPDPGDHWDYRRPAVARIQTAVRRMLLQRAGILTPGREEQEPIPAEAV